GDEGKAGAGIEGGPVTQAAWILGSAVFALASIFVLWPLRGPFLAGEAESRAASLRAEKDRLQGEIRDLEFDLRTGKLSREDYEGARAELVLEAVHVMEALDKAGSRAGIESDIEAWIAEARGKADKP